MILSWCMFYFLCCSWSHIIVYVGYQQIGYNVSQRCQWGYTRTELWCNKCGVYLEQSLLSSKRRPHFQTHKRSWNEHIFVHMCQRDPKPRITVLARASSKLLRCAVLHCTGVRLYYLIPKMVTAQIIGVCMHEIRDALDLTLMLFMIIQFSTVLYKCWPITWNWSWYRLLLLHVKFVTT
jgi:hypothetical protein